MAKQYAGAHMCACGRVCVCMYAHVSAGPGYRYECIELEKDKKTGCKKTELPRVDIKGESGAGLVASSGLKCASARAATLGLLAEP